MSFVLIVFLVILIISFFTGVFVTLITKNNTLCSATTLTEMAVVESQNNCLNTISEIKQDIQYDIPTIIEILQDDDEIEEII